ncbi:MAG: phospholipid carrier-dependent glycosyltransferase [Planctomycetes bacterium]|nr:phospholipid carrier-dependent glycosyltransferase [Planctomycetota bacterium]
MDTEQPSTPTARFLGWLGALAIAALIGVSVASTLGSVGYQPSSDEGFYLRYMQAVCERGPSALPDLFRNYLGDTRAHIFPPPSRIGFVAVSAVWGGITETTLPALSRLSLASHLGLIVAVYAFASRWFGVLKGLLATALVATSTLGLGLSRHALTDSFITLSQFVTVALFIEYAREPMRLARAIAFGLAFTFAILTKEIAVLLAVPFVAFAAVERWYARRDVPVVRTALALALPVFASIAAWVLAAGSPILLFKVMKIVLLSPATNEYAIRYGSGAWFRYPIDELLMSPWTTLVGLMAIGVALWRWRRGEYGSLAVALSLVYIGQVATLGPFTKNLRYVALLEVPLRLLAVMLLWEFCDAKRSRKGLVACCAAVALLCWASWADFQLIWLQFHAYDPVTALLVGVRQMVPTTPGN